MLIKANLVLILCLVTKTLGSIEWQILDHFPIGLKPLDHETYNHMMLEKEITKPEHLLIYNHSLIGQDGTKTSAYHIPIYLDWVKILPEVCTTEINQTQINYYQEIIDLLLHHNIKPVLALYSGNLPQKLTPLGGWTNPIIVQYFANYARQVFKNFGDRIDSWITFHEPRIICESFDGLIGDEFPSGMAEYLCSHNILKAHAEVYHIYDREFRIVQNGEISIAFDVRWVEPEDTSNLNDIRAAGQRMQFELGIYANPLINVNYPAMVKNRVATSSTIEGFEYSRLPTFTHFEKLKISGAYDYIRLIHKGTVGIMASNDDQGTTPLIERDFGGKLIKESEKRWSQEFSSQKLLSWILKNYNNCKLMITL